MNLHVPAEHAPHAAVWMAWPYREDEWPDLAAARREVLAFVEAVARTEPVRLLVHPESEVPEVPPGVRVERVPYGDCWTRDTAPIFAERDGSPVALVFRFDGWGGKFRMPGDEELAARIAALAGVPTEIHDWVLEGGAVEFDGAGMLLTTHCLQLRNPGLDVDALLREAFGVTGVVCLRGALANDHTDGHIDTLARFVAPGRVTCMLPAPGDPNADVLWAVARELEDAGLEVAPLPSPGAVLDERGGLLPASYCNYYLANGQVLVPVYGVAADEAALEALVGLFPEREVRGLSARAIVRGGGALHCITQQQPA